MLTFFWLMNVYFILLGYFCFLKWWSCTCGHILRSIVLTFSLVTPCFQSCVHLSLSFSIATSNRKDSNKTMQLFFLLQEKNSFILNPFKFICWLLACQFSSISQKQFYFSVHKLHFINGSPINFFSCSKGRCCFVE